MEQKKGELETSDSAGLQTHESKDKEALLLVTLNNDCDH